MVLGVGVDLVQTERMARALVANGEGFEARVFTESELAECAHRRDRIEALAARFAAKEACFKALGAGLLERASLKQVEVIRSNGGPPSCGSRASWPSARGAAACGARTSASRTTRAWRPRSWCSKDRRRAVCESPPW